MAEKEIVKNIRYRINIAQGMKGSHSFEATVDMENASMDEVLAESDKLVAKLQSRYPAPMEK